MGKYSELSSFSYDANASKALDAVYAATNDTERREAIETWSRARNALPHVVQRILEDGRVTNPETARELIPELQERALVNTLRDVPELEEPWRKVALSMLCFHAAPSGSAIAHDALESVLRHMDEMPEASQRAKAANFVAFHAPEGSELRQEAAAKFAAFSTRQKLPAVLYGWWSRFSGPA